MGAGASAVTYQTDWCTYVAESASRKVTKTGFKTSSSAESTETCYYMDWNAFQEMISNSGTTEGNGVHCAQS